MVRAEALSRKEGPRRHRVGVNPSKGPLFLGRLIFSGKVDRFEAIDRRRAHAHTVPIDCKPPQLLKVVRIINRVLQVILYTRAARSAIDKQARRSVEMAGYISEPTKNIQMNRAVIGVNQARGKKIPIRLRASEIVMMYRSIDDYARILRDGRFQMIRSKKCRAERDGLGMMHQSFGYSTSRQNALRQQIEHQIFDQKNKYLRPVSEAASERTIVSEND